MSVADTPPPEKPASEKPPSRFWSFLPLALFLGLAGLFAWGMWGGRVDRTASALIGQPAPTTALPALTTDGEFGIGQYAGKVVILNVFASWCAPCRVEHPQLLQLSKDSRFVVVGLAYRDDPEDTLKFLDELGDPFAAVGIDRQGALGVQFGLAGVPETYLIDASGVVRFKVTGELTPQKAGDLARRAVALSGG
jgi:cytochrome c biogenesis protein CcmG, thiol:disulfide interchange protein DsbE